MATTIAAPTFNRPPYGLLSVMEVADLPTNHMDGVQWEALSCDLPYGTITDVCDPQGGILGATPSRMAWGTAEVVTVTAAVNCMDRWNDVEFVRNRFEQVEQVALEKVVEDLLEKTSTDTVENTIDNLKRVVGTLETRVMTSTGVQPWLIVSPVMVEHMDVHDDGGELLTKAGARVVVLTTLEPGTVYATVPFAALRSEVYTIEAPTTNKNDLLRIAARDYIFTVNPCGTVRATVTLP